MITGASGPASQLASFPGLLLLRGWAAAAATADLAEGRVWSPKALGLHVHLQRFAACSLPLGLPFAASATGATVFSLGAPISFVLSSFEQGPLTPVFFFFLIGI